jgi:hypothetical protein
MQFHLLQYSDATLYLFSTFFQFKMQQQLTF